MSMITNTEAASQSPLASKQTDPKGKGQEIEAKPAQAAAITTRGQTRRAKSNALESVGGSGTIDLTPSTATISIPTKKSSKQDIVLGLLRQAEGATIDELMDATRWQTHSVRGFLSGTVRKKLKLHLISDVVGNGVRRYRVIPADQASSSGETGRQSMIDGSASVQGA